MNEAQKLIQLARKSARSAQAVFVPGLKELLEELANNAEKNEERLNQIEEKLRKLEKQ